MADSHVLTVAFEQRRGHLRAVLGRSPEASRQLASRAPRRVRGAPS